MVFTTIKKIRQNTNYQLNRAKVSDEELNDIIIQATTKINSIINVEVREEKVKYISDMRKNNISDGTTTKFYVKNGITNYLSDVNNDGVVNASDVRCFKESSDNIRTELTVTAVDIEDGSWTVSEAPGTDTRRLYVWYAYSFYDVNTPDKLIEILATNLSTAYSYMVKDHNLSNKTKFGNISISRAQGSTAYYRYYDRYEKLLKQVTIPLNKPLFKRYNNLI